MNRNLLFVSLIVFTVFGSSCTFVSDIFVSNRSDSTIRLSYKFKACNSRKENGTIRFPAIIENEKLTKMQREWRWLTDAEYIFDENRCEMTVSVPAGYALLIASLPGYEGFNFKSVYDFPLESIRLVGSLGTVEYSGLQAEKVFEEVDGGYSIVYK